ncbi:hypothetical protein JD969_04300 [Planctomycetota bacterium]|nr:hypothetical protein JD969_04300 [Planctomycetota bacterium]
MNISFDIATSFFASFLCAVASGVAVAINAHDEAMFKASSTIFLGAVIILSACIIAMGIMYGKNRSKSDQLSIGS